MILTVLDAKSVILGDFDPDTPGSLHAGLFFSQDRRDDLTGRR